MKSTCPLPFTSGVYSIGGQNEGIRGWIWDKRVRHKTHQPAIWAAPSARFEIPDTRPSRGRLQESQPVWREHGRPSLLILCGQVTQRRLRNYLRLPSLLTVQPLSSPGFNRGHSAPRSGENERAYERPRIAVKSGSFTRSRPGLESIESHRAPSGCHASRDTSSDPRG